MLRWTQDSLLDLQCSQIGEHYGRYRLHQPENETPWNVPDAASKSTSWEDLGKRSRSGREWCCARAIPG